VSHGQAKETNRKKEDTAMPKITTFLAYDNQAEEAAKFYVSVFKNSRIRSVTRYSEAGPGPKDSIVTVAFELDGQEFVALNGGSHFKFTDGISLSVDCKTQEEVDTYWEKLSERRRGRTMRMAQGQVWLVLADQPDDPGRDAERSRPRQIEEGYGSDAQNEKDQHRRSEKGIQRGMIAAIHRSTPSIQI
jgi:predicted 3-demethylubiquinone-9 3-methyltransferase (glyoxalase superfamily)